MFQNIDAGAATGCDCQKAFGDYSAVGNEAGNDGIHTAVHFKFQWKFEVNTSQQLLAVNAFARKAYFIKHNAFLPASFAKGIFKPPRAFISHITT